MREIQLGYKYQYHDQGRIPIGYRKFDGISNDFCDYAYNMIVITMLLQWSWTYQVLADPEKAI